MEPGTFKDRVLLEGDPHQLIEGMTLAAYATGTDVAYIFLRGEYKLAARRIDEGHRGSLCESAIWARTFSAPATASSCILHVSAGRYMCGEETGMLNALEGKRANPRAKPPFPPVSGLFGKADHSQQRGDALQRAAHHQQWRGVVQKPEPRQGWRDQALRRQRQSETARHLGTADGHHHPGDFWRSTRGECVTAFAFEGCSPEALPRIFSWNSIWTLPMDFTEVQKAGSRMGTGTMIVLDDQTCPVGMVSNLEHFFAQESCGWCTPCWSGLQWVERILKAMEEGHGEPGDLDKLAFQTTLLGARTYLLRACAGRRRTACKAR